MGARRLIHAVTVSNRKGVFWKHVYSRVHEHPAGDEFSSLLTYYYLKSAAKTMAERARILRNYRELSKGNWVLIDSGVFSFKTRFGLRPTNRPLNADGLAALIERGKKMLPEFERYVDEYADFLVASEDAWDYAFDFDADQFLGPDITDALHERLMKRCGLPRSRIIKVYHVARPNVKEWWSQLCANPDYKFLAIEGGGIHARSPHFYRPLIDEAHRNNKLVHVLAATSPTFIKSVPIDTCDSSSHLVGGKFGNVMTPMGNISFSRTPGKGSKQHIELLSPRNFQIMEEYLNQYSLTIEDLKASPYTRNLVNIWFMDSNWDIPFVEQERPFDLFSTNAYFEGE